MNVAGEREREGGGEERVRDKEIFSHYDLC